MKSRSTARAGMTLIELLVAFCVFLMLVGMLVSLSTASLQTWETGEARKDMFDRAQRVLHQMSDDLRNTFADPQWFLTREGQRMGHAGFYCDPDPAKCQRLRFVRCGDEDRMKTGPGSPVQRQIGRGSFTDLWEVAYQHNPPNVPPGLYRGVKYFTRTNPSILEHKEIDSTTTPTWRNSFRLLDDGVLWIAYRFWTQYTTTWDNPGQVREAVRLMKQIDTAKGIDPFKVGPSIVWDSSRSRIPSFSPIFRPLSDDDPDFVYPEIVQITVVVESKASGVQGIRTGDGIEASASTIRLTDARPLPDATDKDPQYVKIGAEWVEYKDKTSNELIQCRRGVRGTSAVAHSLNTPVRYGETFITDVQIPAYREKVR